MLQQGWLSQAFPIDPTLSGGPLVDAGGKGIRVTALCWSQPVYSDAVGHRSLRHTLGPVNTSGESPQTFPGPQPMLRLDWPLWF